MQTFAKLILVALAFTGTGCGWFDYNADEFDKVDEAAKGFENISEDEILGIIESIAVQKAPSFSTEAMRKELSGIATAMRPGVLTQGGFSLADEGKDPCLGADGAQVTNIMGCQAARTRYYYKEVTRLVTKASETMADVTKVMALILGDTNTPQECGTRTEGLTPSEKFQTMLPKKWKGSTIDFILPPTKNAAGVCIETVGGVDYRGFEVLIKRPNDAGTLKPVAHLKVQLALAETTGYKTLLELYVAAAEASLPNSDENTFGKLTVKLKDANNFDIALGIDKMKCSAEYVSIPTELSVEINMTGGVWRGKTLSRNPHFGKSSCEGETNDVNFAEDHAADATHLRGYTMFVYNILSGQFSTDSVPNRFCTKNPALCESGKFKPSLTETVADFSNVYCFEGGATQPTRSNTDSSPFSAAPVCGSLPKSVRDVVSFVFRSVPISITDKLQDSWKTLVQ